MTPRNHWQVSPDARLVEYENGFAIEDLDAPQGISVNDARLTPGHAIWVRQTDTILLAPGASFIWPMIGALHAPLVQDHNGRRFLLDLAAPDTPLGRNRPGIRRSGNGASSSKTAPPAAALPADPQKSHRQSACPTPRSAPSPF
jgi:hypothetical protein